MQPLYEDPCFTFRFAEARIIPRFHLEGVEVGRRVSVFKIDPGTDERLGLLARATVGQGGWVDLTLPIIVRAGEAFVAVPESTSGRLKMARPFIIVNSVFVQAFRVWFPAWLLCLVPALSEPTRFSRRSSSASGTCRRHLNLSGGAADERFL